MISSPKEFVETADRIFMSDKYFLFIFDETVQSPFDSESGTAFRRARDESFELREEDEWKDKKWAVFDNDASFYESDSDFEEIETVAEVVSRLI